MILTTQSEVRKRFKQILVAREELSDDPFKVFVDKQVLLDLINDPVHLKQHLRADNPMASLKGFLNVITAITYYCPTEDFTDEELENFDIDNFLQRLRGEENELV